MNEDVRIRIWVMASMPIRWHGGDVMRGGGNGDKGTFGRGRDNVVEHRNPTCRLPKDGYLRGCHIGGASGEGGSVEG